MESLIQIAPANREDAIKALERLKSEGLTLENWPDYASRGELSGILEKIGCDDKTHELIWGNAGFTMRFSYCSKKCPYTVGVDGAPPKAYSEDIEDAGWSELNRRGSSNLRPIRSVSKACLKYGHENSVDLLHSKKEDVDLKNIKPLY